MTDIAALKQKLRLKLSSQRKALSPEHRLTYSTQIQQYVWQYLAEKQVQQILTYKALPMEVNTDALLSSDDYEVFVPRMLSDTHMQWVQVDANTIWQEVSFGVLEPKKGKVWQPSQQSTALLCPLLGFDAQGHRLGMGKGYFDRWLAQYGQDIDVVGLAFSCQALPKVPVEPHDAPLSTIITEQGIIHVQ
jgi:5-formyltetrahydrofolate cyclo-ligase